MIDSFFEQRPKKHVKDLNIVPILDMLTTVIFFLLLSTSFMEYTKLTVPPSKVTTITDPLVPPPLAPKVLLVEDKGALRMILFWGGEKPGEVSERIPAPGAPPLDDPLVRRAEIMKTSEKLVKDFTDKNPNEKSLQIGLGAKVPYQDLISLMDGVREKMADVVLISHHEAEARANGTAPAPEAKSNGG